VAKKVEVVLETDNVLAFHHIRPYYEHHIVVIPKKHLSSIYGVKRGDMLIMVEIFEVLQQISAKMNAEFGACTVSTNVGGYQTTKHMHWHVRYGEKIR